MNSYGPLRLTRAGPLKVGDRGEAVAEMQRIFGQEPDGHFGWELNAAVVRVQRHYGLATTGEIDGLTAFFILRYLQK